MLILKMSGCKGICGKLLVKKEVPQVLHLDPVVGLNVVLEDGGAKGAAMRVVVSLAHV